MISRLITSLCLMNIALYAMDAEKYPPTDESFKSIVSAFQQSSLTQYPIPYIWFALHKALSLDSQLPKKEKQTLCLRMLESHWFPSKKQVLQDRQEILQIQKETFIKLAQNNDNKQIEHLLDRGASPFSALFVTCNAKEENTRQLYDKITQIIVDKKQEYPAGLLNKWLFKSTGHYSKSLFAQFLLKQGAQVNCTNKCGSTPLHRAVESFYHASYCKPCAHVREEDHASMIKVLLQEGANPNKKNNFNISPLYEGAFCGQVTTLLLAAGGDMHQENDRRGSTPFLQATERNYMFMGIREERLIPDDHLKPFFGDDINRRYHDGQTLLHIYLRQIASDDVVSDNGVPTIGIFLQNNASLLVEDNFRVTALDLLINYCSINEEHHAAYSTAKVMRLVEKYSDEKTKTLFFDGLAKIGIDKDYMKIYR